MGDEAVDGSKMGTKLIFFVAIISLALVAFIVGKSLVNTGVDNMETAVQSINDSRFSDYNGKVVRGRAVKSALENFTNEEVAIVVCTLNMADTGGNFSTLAGFAGETSGDNNVVITVENGVMTDSSGHKCTTVKGINYNARLDSKHMAISMENGEAKYEYDFQNDDAGNVAYNMATGNITKKGTGEYVADNSSFNANLIKNSAGEICGIVFVQKKLN